MTDFRSFEVAGPRCSLSRTVDLDCASLTDDERMNLEYEGRLRGWIEGSLTVKSLRKTKRIEPMPGKIRGRLSIIQGEGGKAFDDGDEETRRIAAYSWHVLASEFDVWPMYSTLWRPWDGSALDMSEPTGKQYGEFIYDTWVNVYELERYFYNWCLRAHMWLEAGFSPDVKRWKEFKGANGGYEGDYVTAHRAATFLGDEPMPTHFREKIGEPTGWIRHDVRGGAESWSWPVEWLSWVRDGVRYNVSDMDVSRHCFSWHELLIRFEELPTIRRAAVAFGSDESDRDRRSCANKLAYRVQWFMERFGPWYSYAKVMWLAEGTAERRFML